MHARTRACGKCVGISPERNHQQQCFLLPETIATKWYILGIVLHG